MTPHTPMHFEIPVDNIERAKKFYEGLFDWKIQPAGSDFADYYLIFTVPFNEQGKPEGSGINGGMMKRTNPGQGPINYITVEDIDLYLKKVEELGGEILMPKMPVTGMGWNAVVKDTENNTFGLWQKDEKAA